MYIFARFNIQTEINLAVMIATPVYAISPFDEWSSYSLNSDLIALHLCKRKMTVKDKNNNV